MNLKKIELLGGSIVIFILGFFLHDLYKNYPNFFTSILAPVNESVFEHMKLFFTGVIIFGIIQRLFYKDLPKNFLLAKVLSIIVMVLVMIPMFYISNMIIGEENFVVTIVVFFISIIVGQIVSLYIMENKKDKDLDSVAIILLIILFLIFIQFTYNPPHLEIFKDTTTLKYGIN